MIVVVIRQCSEPVDGAVFTSEPLDPTHVTVWGKSFSRQEQYCNTVHINERNLVFLSTAALTARL